MKFRAQTYDDFNIHYWRTKSGAEVDFILYKDPARPLPIEVKFRAFKQPSISRGYRSFLQAYQPKFGVVITKSLTDSLEVEGCQVHFIALQELSRLEEVLKKL